jgi:hypothetical protein
MNVWSPIVVLTAKKAMTSLPTTSEGHAVDIGVEESPDRRPSDVGRRADRVLLYGIVGEAVEPPLAVVRAHGLAVLVDQDLDLFGRRHGGPLSVGSAER